MTEAELRLWSEVADSKLKVMRRGA